MERAGVLALFEVCQVSEGWLLFVGHESEMSSFVRASPFVLFSGLSVQLSAASKIVCRWSGQARVYVRSFFADGFLSYLVGEDVQLFLSVYVQLYLHDRLGNKYVEFNQMMSNDTLDSSSSRLADGGFSFNETATILYSKLAKENLEWLFSMISANVTSTRVNEGLALIEKRQISYTSVVDDNEFQTSLQTNSQVLYFLFDEIKGISFDVIGIQNTRGYFNITMPRSLIDGHFSITIDKVPAEFIITQNSSHSSVYLEYAYSAHSIQITATYLIPESPGYLLSLFMRAILVVVAATRLRTRTDGGYVLI